jgi:signal transduction histidine kinase
MERVVAGLLTLARADAGELQVALQPVDLRDVVRETVSLLAPLATERQVTLEANVPPEPCLISGDADRLHEIASNLAANAVQYNRAGGRVDIRLSRTADWVTLEVADTGIGIAPDALAQLGGRFFRVDAARSTEGTGGVGLGLAIVKRLVAAHGGEFSIHSRQAPSASGTTVTVRLPVQATN